VPHKKTPQSGMNPICEKQLALHMKDQITH